MLADVANHANSLPNATLAALIDAQKMRLVKKIDYAWDQQA